MINGFGFDYFFKPQGMEVKYSDLTFFLEIMKYERVWREGTISCFKPVETWWVEGTQFHSFFLLLKDHNTLIDYEK